MKRAIRASGGKKDTPIVQAAYNDYAASMLKAKSNAAQHKTRSDINFIGELTFRGMKYMPDVSRQDATTPAFP
ncbi:MAG: hypothetical protein R3B12_03710 [Candidatus Saccharimonadales bacterium]